MTIRYTAESDRIHHMILRLHAAKATAHSHALLNDAIALLQWYAARVMSLEAEVDELLGAGSSDGDAACAILRERLAADGARLRTATRREPLLA